MYIHVYTYITNSSWGHCPRSPPSSPTVSLKIGEIWRPFWFWGLLHGSFSAFHFFFQNLATILVWGALARLVQRFPFFPQIWRPFWFWGEVQGSFSVFHFLSKSGNHFSFGGLGKARLALSSFFPKSGDHFGLWVVASPDLTFTRTSPGLLVVGPTPLIYRYDY